MARNINARLCLAYFVLCFNYTHQPTRYQVLPDLTTKIPNAFAFGILLITYYFLPLHSYFEQSLVRIFGK